MKKIIALLVLIATITAITLPVNAATDQYIEIAGKEICSTLWPAGGGTKNLRIIKDGYVPTEATEALKTYTTYIANAGSHVEYVGYEFDATYTIKAVEFYEGLHYNNGGWFKDVGIEIRQNGEWKAITSTSSPAYPADNTQAAHGDPFQRYTFSFAATACDGVRLTGTAGGTANFITVSEIKVVATSNTALVLTTPEYRAGLERATKGNIEGISTPITNGVPTNTGGGSQNVYTINDGVTVALDNANNRLQFDTYSAAAKTDTTEYIGYEFPGTYKVRQLIFQDGKMWDKSGGWFADGSLKVQILVNGQWKDVTSTCAPAYPNSNEASAFTSFSTYTFSFTPVECSGIRLIGTAGGPKYYISCTELTVVAEPKADTPVPPVTTKPGTSPSTSDIIFVAFMIIPVAAASYILVSKKKRTAR